MKNVSFLTDPDDIQWAIEKFAPSLRSDYFPGCCLLTGNEDAPDMLEFYAAAEPEVSDIPFITVRFSENKA